MGAEQVPESCIFTGGCQKTDHCYQGKDNLCYIVGIAFIVLCICRLPFAGSVLFSRTQKFCTKPGHSHIT